MRATIDNRMDFDIHLLMPGSDFRKACWNRTRDEARDHHQPWQNWMVRNLLRSLPFATWTQNGLRSVFNKYWNATRRYSWESLRYSVLVIFRANVVRRPGDGIAKKNRKENLSIVRGLYLFGSCFIDCSTLCIKPGRWVRWGSFCCLNLACHARGDFDFFTLLTSRDHSEIQ